MPTPVCLLDAPGESLRRLIRFWSGQSHKPRALHRAFAPFRNAHSDRRDSLKTRKASS